MHSFPTTIEGQILAIVLIFVSLNNNGDAISTLPSRAVGRSENAGGGKGQLISKANSKLFI